MGRLYMMTTIINRKLSKKYMHLYKQDELQVTFITLGSGTASGDVLDYLGLEATEKAVIFAVLEESSWIKTKKDLQKKFHIDAPGEGIAFVVPLSSIGGKKTLQFWPWNRRV